MTANLYDRGIGGIKRRERPLASSPCIRPPVSVPLSPRRTTGLYIHFPFCIRKCSYCDFYSLPYQADQAEAYYEALLSEVKEVAEDQTWGRIGSIYLGGGTPSLMKAGQLETLLALIHASFSVIPDCEITMEANPGTVDLDSLKAIREAGVNRISLGVQSFNEAELQLLGRIHSRDEVFRTVESLHQAEIKNFGMDLIYGIPGQTIVGWRQSLQSAIDLSPRHVSCYLLQMDETVPLAVRVQNGEMVGLPEEDEAEMYYTTIHQLISAGYQHYEISNFCRPGFASRHNLNYWEAGEYLGLGAGAVSFKVGQRYRNLPRIDQYMQNLLIQHRPPPREVMESLEGIELSIDAILMGLRMIQGINVKEFTERFGLDPMTTFTKAITESQKEGLVEYHTPWLRLTSRGYFLSNRVFVRIMETGP